MLATWTVVTRQKGGRFFRPVAGAPVAGTWHEATEAAAALAAAIDEPTTEVWYVPTEGTGHPDDGERVLNYAGKWFPIRWDAAPTHTFEVSA